MNEEIIEQKPETWEDMSFEHRVIGAILVIIVFVAFLSMSVQLKP